MFYMRVEGRPNQTIPTQRVIYKSKLWEGFCIRKLGDFPLNFVTACSNYHNQENNKADHFKCISGSRCPRSRWRYFIYHHESSSCKMGFRDQRDILINYVSDRGTMHRYPRRNIQAARLLTRFCWLITRSQSLQINGVGNNNAGRRSPTAIWLSSAHLCLQVCVCACVQ